MSDCHCFILEKNKQALRQFKLKFPIGCKVISIETIPIGHWHDGHKADCELKHINHGVVIEHKMNFGEPTAKIKIASGHLFDLKSYEHGHAWSVGDGLSIIPG